MRLSFKSFRVLFAKSVNTSARGGLLTTKKLRSISYLGIKRRNSHCSAARTFLRGVGPRVTVVSYSSAGACKRPSPRAMRQLGTTKDRIRCAVGGNTVAIRASKGGLGVKEFQGGQ